ncbi:MAG: hypothetical protein O3A64_02305 [Proteobacteria bacterium]|jgi:hypothetical protein|nr:hypothetical protein [Pseudomonadota bacterium]
MDINKWKSVAVDIDNYYIIKAMGHHGRRKPGAQIAKLVDSEIAKLAVKNKKNSTSFRSELISQGKSLDKK